MIIYHVLPSMFRNLKYILRYKLSPPKPFLPNPNSQNTPKELTGYCQAFGGHIICN
jgi:hypothetical protein